MSAGRRGRLAAFNGVLAATLALAAASSAHNGDVLKGWGTASIDGRMTPGEWDHAAWRTTFLAGGVPAQIFVMNDRSRLYLALRVFEPRLGTDEGVDFHFDNKHDGNGGDLGEDVLRLRSGEGPLDMYYEPTSKTIYPDQHDGGSADVQGAARYDRSASFFELSHPLDTGDDAHDFSLAPGSRVGFAVSFNDCFCPQERISNWPAPGPWADIAIARALPRVTLSEARFDGRWNASRFVGRVVLAGRTTDGAQLDAVLRRGGGGDRVVRRLDARVGPFTTSLPVPKDVLPGPYTVELHGTSDGYPLGGQTRTVRLAPPREGVVSRVQVRASEGAPWSTRTSLPSGTRKVWVRFSFAARPRSTCTTHTAGGRIELECRPPITVSWLYPSGKPAGPPKSKGNGPTIVTFVGSTSHAALHSGTWKCVLRVGSAEAKEVAITIES